MKIHITKIDEKLNVCNIKTNLYLQKINDGILHKIFLM